jgi:asparagine synthase (glutamine-hydrolysing)
VAFPPAAGGLIFMCGIGGIIDFSARPVQASDLATLGSALAHRGPDGEGTWFNSNRDVGLVHRRLAILDASERSNQPMVSDDGRHVLIYNGEIYNFLELRTELSALGHVFRSDGDTEVILAAWRQWGPAMQLRLNGMWALAIYDCREQQLFLSRDRFGIKPLLYSLSDARFVFASEMRALRSVSFVGATFDTEVGLHALRSPFSIEGTERTLFSDIRRLPAGHCAMVGGGKLSVTRWWRTVDHLVEVPREPVEQQTEFRRLLIDSVRLRLRSDVPIGTSLSGGFDSSTIAGVMAAVAVDAAPHQREASDWRRAFVASMPGETYDETDYALEAAQFAGAVPRLIKISENDALERIEQTLRDLDDVYIGLPTAPWLVYQRMRGDGVVVSLDGHGADELMGGYRQRGQSVGFRLRNLVAAAGVRMPSLQRVADAGRTLMRKSRGVDYTRSRNTDCGIGKAAAATDTLPQHWGALNVRLYQMFHCDVLPTILRNFDRISMAHGVEVRMPFMDWRLVTYTMSLPDDAKFHAGAAKYVARAAMQGYLPDRIRLNKQKTGFNSPMPTWLNGPLRGWIDAVMSRPCDAFDSLVRGPDLRRRIHELGQRQRWTWESATGLWPYINLKWYLSQR